MRTRGSFAIDSLAPCLWHFVLALVGPFARPHGHRTKHAAYPDSGNVNVFNRQDGLHDDVEHYAIEGMVFVVSGFDSEVSVDVVVRGSL